MHLQIVQLDLFIYICKREERKINHIGFHNFRDLLYKYFFISSKFWALQILPLKRNLDLEIKMS
jgi:hypothetical protein